MAKVTIIITDTPGEKNNVNISMESDPEWNMKDDDKNTQAQICGIRFLNFLQEEAKL